MRFQGSVSGLVAVGLAVHTEAQMIEPASFGHFVAVFLLELVMRMRHDKSKSALSRLRSACLGAQR